MLCEPLHSLDHPCSAPSQHPFPAYGHPEEKQGNSHHCGLPESISAGLVANVGFCGLAELHNINIRLGTTR